MTQELMHVTGSLMLYVAGALLIALCLSTLAWMTLAILSEVLHLIKEIKKK